MILSNDNVLLIESQHWVVFPQKSSMMTHQWMYLTLLLSSVVHCKSIKYIGLFIYLICQITEEKSILGISYVQRFTCVFICMYVCLYVCNDSRHIVQPRHFGTLFFTWISKNSLVFYVCLSVWFLPSLFYPQILDIEI